MGKLLARLEGISTELRDLTARVAGYVVLFLGFGIALAVLGVSVQPLLAAAIQARRSEVEVRIRSRDFDETQHRLVDTVGAVGGVLGEPPPAVFLTSIDPVRITALVLFWHDPDDGLAVRGKVIRALAGAGQERRRWRRSSPLSQLRHSRRRLGSDLDIHHLDPGQSIRVRGRPTGRWPR